jgi:hypothetical protein
MPKVSVIIPNQKNAPFLVQTIETLIAQTMSQWDLIVVDDGSDSNLPETVQSYSDRCSPGAISLVVVSDKAAGIPSLVNSGVCQMNSEYFAWLNPGELLEPTKLEDQVRFLDENPTVGLVHSSYVTIDVDGDVTGEYHPPDDRSATFLRLVESDCINPNTALVRRSILDQVGPFVETDKTFPELWRAAAYRHTLRIALKSEIGRITRGLQRSRSWSPDMEYSRPSLGSPLERGFVADCFEEEAVTPTPEIVAALVRSGLIGISTRAFRALSVADQARALDLVKISGLDHTWFARHSARWWSPAFSGEVAPAAGRDCRIVQGYLDDLSGVSTAGPDGSTAVMESVTVLPKNTGWRLAPCDSSIGVHAADRAQTDDALDLEHIVVGDFDDESRKDLLGLDKRSGNWWRTRVEDSRERRSDGILSQDLPSLNAGTVGLQVDARVEEMLIEQQDESDLTVRRVPQVTNDTLAQHIMTEIDGLGKALGTDRLLAARMLLDWTSNAANFAVGGQIATETTQFVAAASAAEIYYEQFLPRRGAVYCGGMAVFYDLVLKTFGYDSFTIDFGDVSDGLSHVAVNVPVCDGTTLKHYIFDPTFNTTFHDRTSGDQLDFFELIDALDGDMLDRIEVITRSVQGRDWVSIGPLMESFFGLKEVLGDRYVYGRSDGRLTDYFVRYESLFAANGYAPVCAASYS